jgi:hypothetical protein
MNASAPEAPLRWAAGTNGLSEASEEKSRRNLRAARCGGSRLMLVTGPPLGQRTVVLDSHRAGRSMCRSTAHEPQSEGQIPLPPAAPRRAGGGQRDPADGARGAASPAAASALTAAGDAVDHLWYG